MNPNPHVLRAEGASVMYLAADGQALSLLAVSDKVKTSTPETFGFQIRTRQPRPGYQIPPRPSPRSLTLNTAPTGIGGDRV